ncbi:lymphocyte antigen 6 family member K [Rhinolophus ferrumequinum]|uniref:Lymphocyte antigen 6 family member K n=1 Tax=Rhinolophus ferrumequinum TaxID=59479 RepID=A0A7J7VEQ8_RHIFE|nr:lymphocyte antigen 6K [Rhinolophus ferrumequinum]KAF6323456.1 lymphocyte antigen 6 family member K [Rhinolophus ferrumequinum]
MTVLLALLLVMGLPWVETNVTLTGRQALLKCHVCEEYNTVRCTEPTICPKDSEYCATVIVRILVRFIYVSRQCSRFCPIIHPNEYVFKSFVLVKPMPFLYASCCRNSLCNNQAPQINDTERRYRQSGRAGDMQSSSAGLMLLLTLTSASLVLRPP